MRDPVILTEYIKRRNGLAAIILHKGTAISKGAMRRTRKRIGYHTGNGFQSLPPTGARTHKGRTMR